MTFARMGYAAWQDALVDVTGLHCGLTDAASGEKSQFGLMLRKRRKDEAPTSLWTQDADDAQPKEIYKVCETTPDELGFKPTEAPCPAGYAADSDAKPSFDFTINRKTLYLTVANRTPPLADRFLSIEIHLLLGWQMAATTHHRKN